MSPKKTGVTPVRNVRIPEDIWRPALARAQARGETITAVIERALQAYLAGAESLTVSTLPGYRVSTTTEREPRMYTITDPNAGRTATVAHDQIAATLRPWFEGAPDEVLTAVDKLEAALTPGSSTAHDQDALATYLDLTVQPA
jgi:hypothetical protein